MDMYGERPTGVILLLVFLFYLQNCHVAKLYLKGDSEEPYFSVSEHVCKRVW